MILLTTSRLHIRPFREDDIDAVAVLQDECFGPAPRAARREWLDWTVRNYRALADLHQPPYGDYAVVAQGDGAVVGAVGLVPSFGPFGKLPWFGRSSPGGVAGFFTAELGLFWAVRESSRRLGYASEAAAAMASFAFETLHVARLVATTEHDNLPSIGVMRKLGMSIEVNPDAEPAWFQTVGVLANPRIGKSP
jgi:RimJ/RimL family protein N-acetyltransferase